LRSTSRLTLAVAVLVQLLLLPSPPAPRAAAATAARVDAGIHLKFRAGSSVRLREGRLVSDSVDLDSLHRLLGPPPGLRIERLFSTPEQALNRLRERIEARSRRPQVNLNLYFRLIFVRNVAVEPLLSSLNALPVVEIAYREPDPPPPPATPSFVARQGYRGPAPAGIDAVAAENTVAGLGGRVRVADVEYGWNLSHEDLGRVRARAVRVDNGSFCNPFLGDDHGTAVLGELAADRDTVGVTGLVPRAALTLVNSAVDRAGACVWNLADAVNLAHRNLGPGDVLLIEQQARSASGFVPVEWVPAVYDAIFSATSDGIIVIEPAGNGTLDLDEREFGSPFPRGLPDSGAIVVGAGGAPGCGSWVGAPRARIDFSNFGSRINLQGWGECVVTTGYGDLYGGTRNTFYAGEFAGTSSAAAMVAAAAASLSSATEARTGEHLSSRRARSILRDTGSAQDPSVPGQIGPLPNLRAALAAASGRPFSR
jgi:serine protease